MFRNENERIVRKSKAAQERSRAQAADRRPLKGTRSGQVTLRPGSDAQNQDQSSGRPMRILPQDVNAYGLQFFFQHFSSKPSGEGSFSRRSSQHMFHDLDTDPSFRNAVISIGLAALSNVKRDRALLSVARQQYGISLRSVRRGVEVPPCDNAGSLLKMISMLAIFEVSFLISRWT